MSEEINKNTINPLLTKIKMPGESFTLPSQGCIYHEGVLDEKAKETGEVHVYPLTAIDEILLKSPDKLLSGEAVLEVFKHRIPSILKPLELFSKDVDFLMIALRKVTYGIDFEVDYLHNDCSTFTGEEDDETPKSRGYVINLEDLLRKTVRIDPTIMKKQYSMNLVNEATESSQLINFQPVTLQAVLDLAQINDPNLSADDVQIKMFEALINVIDSVDGITDKKMILEWFKSVPAPWIKQITDKIEDLGDWGPALEYKFNCRDCGEEIITQVPINPISFFFTP